MILAHPIKDVRTHQAVYGIDSQSLDRLVEHCEDSYVELYDQTFAQSLIENPKGNQARLRSIRDLVCYTLMFLKSGITFDLAGFLIGFDRSRAHRQFCNGIRLLHYTFDLLDYLPLRSFENTDQFDQYFEHISVLIIDATEQRIQRPEDDEYQRQLYSGKKKTHTIKSMVISTLDRKIHYLSEAYTGGSHDFSLIKTEFPPEQKWFSGKQVRVDLGYLGFDKQYHTARQNENAKLSMYL